MSIQSVSYPDYFSTRWNYSINTHFSPKKSQLLIQLPVHFLYTTEFPRTYEILKQFEPRILKTRCFNKLHLPFSVEVKKTETAHLFEHIMLEYLCQEQVKTGAKCARFSGITQWNWNRDIKGTFHVTIQGTMIEMHSFLPAFSKSVLLFETILASKEKQKKQEKINSKQIALDYLFVRRSHE